MPPWLPRRSGCAAVRRRGISGPCVTLPPSWRSLASSISAAPNSQHLRCSRSTPPHIRDAARPCGRAAPPCSAAGCRFCNSRSAGDHRGSSGRHRGRELLRSRLRGLFQAIRFRNPSGIRGRTRPRASPLSAAAPRAIQADLYWMRVCRAWDYQSRGRLR